MNKNASSERTHMPKNDMKRRKSPMLRTRGGERERRKGKKNSLLQRHHSICVFEVAFSDEIASTAEHLYPSHNSKKELYSKNHFNFPEISESRPCEKKQYWIFPPFSF
ncbi:hypothetical protein CDAR_424101 [Caerostris darwini]|uniref:Uncharacterized protein n=1 Tax=Caerostris darwini TaxID=1538125 RepID=A0AAV4T217_9ARAC|nr:hypothetical protein CDAR_424101 [Caerostris darwini]